MKKLIVSHSFAETKVSRFVTLAMRGVACALLTLPIAQYSQAQDAEEATQTENQSNSETEFEVINVRGVRASTKQEIDLKKDAVGISDFLASDDVGKLPDYNIADAIRRAPGVNTIFDEDEGQFVALRGLSADYTYTTFDGGSVAAVDLGGFFGDGRRVLLEAVPSGAVKGVEVKKTLTPALDGNAIGGHVNLITKSAFDKGETSFVATGVLGNYTDQNVTNNDEQLSYRSEATFSTVFGDDDQFGVVVSGFNNYKKRDQERSLPGIFPTFYDTSVAKASGDFFPIVGADTPNAAYFNRVYPEAGYSNEVDRQGIMVKLEHMPSPEFNQTLNINYFAQNENERQDQSTLLTFFPGPVSATADGGLRFEDSQFGLRSQTWDAEKFVTHINYSLNKYFDEDNKLKVSAVYSEAGYSEIKPRLGTSSISAGGLTTTGGEFVSYVFDNPAPLSDPKSFDPDPVTGAARVTANGLYDQTDDNATVQELAVDHEFRLGESDEGLGFGFGAKYRSTEREFTLIRESFAQIEGTNPQFSNDFLLSTTYSPSSVSNGFPLIDIRGFDFDAARNGSHPYLARTSIVQGITSSNDFAVNEDIFAAYAMLNIKEENYQIVAGVRYEKTDVEAQAVDLRGAAPQATTRNNDYDNFLPSLTFKYNISDELVFKSAVSRAIGRPGHAPLSGNISSSIDNGITTTNVGNTDLKPRLADNVDIALDYYFADGDGLVSIALFYKDIQDEIFSRTTLLANGDRINRPENAENAQVTGLELSFVNTKFDMLPGFLSDFGMSANLTLIDAETTITENGEKRKLDFLVEQPENIVNVSLFYQQDAFEGRVTYNRTDSYLAFGQPTSNLGWFQAERTFLDAQVSYELTENFKVFAEGRNLLNESEDSIFGPGLVGSGQIRVADRSTFGTSYWLGVTYTM
jgi:TonB-dependent receptor